MGWEWGMGWGEGWGGVRDGVGLRVDKTAKHT